jgi:hypothetical protein
LPFYESIQLSDLNEIESAGCDTAALIAAFVKLPVSTTAAKCRI